MKGNAISPCFQAPLVMDMRNNISAIRTGAIWFLESHRFQIRPRVSPLVCAGNFQVNFNNNGEDLAFFLAIPEAVETCKTNDVGDRRRFIRTNIV